MATAVGAELSWSQELGVSGSSPWVQGLENLSPPLLLSEVMHRELAHELMSART